MFLLRVLIRSILGTRRIALNIIVAMGILVAVSLAAEHGGIVRNIIAEWVNKPSQRILGVKVIDVANPVDNPTERIKKDVQDQVDTVKKQSMNVKVSDVMDTASRVQKIVHDVQSMQKYLQDQIRTLLANLKLQ